MIRPISPPPDRVFRCRPCTGLVGEMNFTPVCYCMCNLQQMRTGIHGSSLDGCFRELTTDGDVILAMSNIHEELTGKGGPETNS